MELVLNFGDRVAGIGAGEIATLQPRIMLVGAVSRPSHVHPLGLVDIVGARFAPAGVRAFVDPPASELVDDTFAVEQVVGRSLARDLEAIVGACPPDDRIARIQDALVEKLKRNRHHDPLVSRLVEVMDRAGGKVSIEGLASRTSLTRRQLERRFLSAVGQSPKALAQVFRFQRVLAHLTAEQPSCGASLAADCGYYDQAHLIRDFKRFAGKTPRAFLRRDQAFGDLFLPGPEDGAGSVSSMSIGEQ